MFPIASLGEITEECARYFLNNSGIDMKVLVTGATSGLGRNAVEFLCQKGISVRATGRNEAMGKLLEMGAEFVPADLTELVSSQAKVMLAGIDTLWHCSKLYLTWQITGFRSAKRSRHSPPG